MTREEGQLLRELIANHLNQREATEEQTNGLNRLRERLQNEISKYPNGAFVKLSCRSPKDATATAPEMLKLFRENIEKLKENNVKVDENQRLIQLYSSHIKTLHSYTADDALKWFIRSCRIDQDIEFALQQKEFDIQVQFFAFFVFTND